MEVEWTEPALRDVAQVHAFIRRDNAPFADNQVAIIVAAVAGLAHFPEMGRPGRRSGTRELVVSKTQYVVPYRVRGDAVEILRVLHSRRLWPDTL
jgi:addiction module RelE/StbE family toxin